MKNILLIIGALLLSAPGFAQIVDNDFVSIPEPNASSFAKFIENPVNKFNGGADISIPVYTLKDGEIEIPITLRYNTSGIKVAEEASWVGLGWNLNVGGVITRNAVGLLGYDHMFGIFESYEDSYSGPLYPEYPSADMYTPWGWSGSLIKDPECHGFSSGGTSGASIDPSDWGPAKEGLSVGHGMPDIFYFSFLNYSGKFFIDHRDESIHIIDKSDDIQFTTYQAGTYWKATTPDGSSFYFEALSSSFSINSQTSSLSYYLTKIIYPNGRKVEFAYQTGGGTSQYALTENIHLRESTKHRMDPKYNSSMDRFSSGGRILSQILTDNFEINFTVNNRQDIPGDKKLDLITVIDNTTNQEKVFEFDNDAYFESQTGGNYWSGGDLESARKRLKLQAFGQKDLPKHIFNYSNIELPTKTSYAVDYWGYYNGAINNNTLIPSMNSYYLLSTIPDGTLAAMASYGGSAQKGCHPDIVSAGMLESITYPTGGKTSFNYESNSFTNRYYASIPDQQVYNQTVADQKIIGEANDDNCGAKSTWFPIDLDESANVKINFRFDKGIGTGADVRDAYGQISTRHPSQNYPIDPIESYSPFVDIDGNYVYEFTFNEDLTAGNYGVYVNIPNELGCQSEGSGTMHISVQADIVVTPELVLPEGFGDISYGGGVRIFQIEQQDIAGNTILKTNYDYSDGYLMTPLKYDFSKQVSYTEFVLTGTNGDGNLIYGCEDSYGTEAVIKSNSLISSSFDALGGPVGYSNVTVHKESPSYSVSNYEVGSTSYFYNTSAPLTGIGLPSSPYQDNGKLNKVIYYNSSGKKVSSIDHDYNLIGNHLYIGMTLGVLGLYSPVMRYPLTSRSVQLESSTETYYDENEVPILTKRNDYEYNDVNMLSKSTENTSEDENKTITTDYLYVADYTYIAEISKDETLWKMKTEEHAILPLISKIVKVDNNYTYGEFYEYAESSSFFVSEDGKTFYSFVKDKIKIVPSGWAIENELKYLHDAKGNVVQVQKDSDLITSYIWGYNQSVPVAKIIGSSYASSISFLSGGLSSIQSLDGEALLESLDVIRIGFADQNVLVTTYTYDLLNGLTNQVDPNGLQTTYEYDDFGRLKLIKDSDEKILSHYEYHYADQTLPDQESQTNYVYSYIPQIAFEIESDVVGGSVGQVFKKASYFDGIGRSIQTVSKMDSPNENDIVFPIEYDEFGRKNKNYLPYKSEESNGKYKPITTNIGDATARVYEGSPHANFYQEANDNIANDTRPFSETEFEESPLNRPIQQYGVGQDWKDNSRSTNFRYEINNATEVRLWKIEENIPISVAPFEFYNSGELYKNVTVDEQSHEVIEFVDKQQKTILKRVQVHNSGEQEQWADTYYVYDVFGNLRFVLPPESVNILKE